MRYQRARARRAGFVNRVLHHGRECGRHVDAFLRQYGPTLKTVAMSAAPALANAGMPQAAVAAAVMGQATGSYASLRSQMPE